MYLAVVALVAQVFLWSQSRYANINVPKLHSSSYSLEHTNPAPPPLVPIYTNISFVNPGLYVLENLCEPLRFPVADQCTHVRTECGPPETFLSISYLETYYCSTPALRPLSFLSLVLWLFFLFSFIGICASDFFCPNLATIADTLGINENVAGVTFLAFGNGSPDVFSTFSAMRAGSGSLAIGELLGAASFVVSVVAGSMPLVKPFRVNPFSFVRDVGFFTLAVACILSIVIDGNINAREALFMVGLYFVYVSVVIGGTWWENRQARLSSNDILGSTQHSDSRIGPDQNGSTFEPYHDDIEAVDPSATLSAQPNPTNLASHKHDISRTASRPSLHISQPSSRASSVPPSPSTAVRSSSHVHQLPSFSLLGALEFRTVVNSHHGVSQETLNLFDGPVSPYAAGHYNRRSVSSSGSVRRMSIPTPSQAFDANDTADLQRDPWDAAFGAQLRERDENTLAPGVETHRAKSPVPSIHLFSSSDAAPLTLFRPNAAPAPAYWRTVVTNISDTLFPSLADFFHRSWLWKIVAVCSAPAILMLTLTLPVVVGEPNTEAEQGEAAIQLPDTPLLEAQLGDESEAEEDLLQARVESEDHIYDVHFNKWLTVAQCVISPVFCVSVLFAEQKNVKWYILIAALCGLSIAILAAVFARDGKNSTARLARCFVGFGVAIVWIMVIADEVVQLLQTFGRISGLSDAIIGLTIFAFGNSLADFVANLTVAMFAPIMGISACFGGPMLNMLLGIGISGSYVIYQTGESYQVDMSPTLLVSAIGLLCLLVSTLVVVPLNDFNLTRRWGLTLIAGYVVVMVVNVVVEVKESR